MSWRLLFLTLLLAVGAAAFGGVQLGDWLVAHAPMAAPPPGQDAADPDRVVLDANGRPYVAQPPQPRVDGTLGVPEGPRGAEWQVPTVSLFDTVTDPSVSLARDGLSEAEARELAEASSALPAGPADVVTVDLVRPGEGSRPQAIPGQPPIVPIVPGLPPPPDSAAVAQAAPMPPAPGQPAAPGQQDWRDALRRDLQQCASQGFFDRPSCSWAARNKYCAPNRAWGTIPECPRRPFD